MTRPTTLIPAIVFALVTAEARSEDLISQPTAARLAADVVAAAHPTAKKIVLLGYKEATGKDVLIVTLKAQYHGAFVGYRYAADVTVTVPRDKRPLRAAIAYRDDNSIPANKKNLAALEAKIGDKLPAAVASAAPAPPPPVVVPVAPVVPVTPAVDAGAVRAAAARVDSLDFRRRELDDKIAAARLAVAASVTAYNRTTPGSAGELFADVAMVAARRILADLESDRSGVESELRSARDRLNRLRDGR